MFGVGCVLCGFGVVWRGGFLYRPVRPWKEMRALLVPSPVDTTYAF
jgi:hypothetical protein